MTSYLNLPFISSFLSTDQFDIHYVHGGSGPPLILLHGGGTWLYTFRQNMDALSRHFSVYALDLPGHGHTKTLDSTIKYDVATICRALVDFMDRLGIAKSHFTGHSWGGGWSIFFADQHPHRLEKLVLINSSGMHRHEHVMWEFMKIPYVGEFLFKFINAHAIRKGLEDSFYEKSYVTREMIQNIHDPLRHREKRKAQLSYSRNVDWRKAQDALSRISKPTLIIWGRHDRYIDVKYGRRMADLMPNAKLVVLENCGHSSHEECPETVNRLIINFLN
jgi:pimeloyl-ACP methyl ester carboxylesterase